MRRSRYHCADEATQCLRAAAVSGETANVILLPGPAGAIELACGVPESGGARNGVAIICHPNPLQGGTMFNKVVTTLDRALLDIGVATVRFNFRGVGKSRRRA